MQRITRALVVLSVLLILPLTAKNAYAGSITIEVFAYWSGAYGNASSADFFAVKQGTAREFTAYTGGGFQSAKSISLLAPGAYGGNDNVFNPTGTGVDSSGLAFQAGSIDYKIYFDPVAQKFFECASTATGCTTVGNGVALTNFVFSSSVISAMPEPGSILLLFPGLLAFAGFVRWKQWG